MDLTGLGSYTDYMTDPNRIAMENLQKNLEDAAKVFSDDNEEEGYAANMVDTFKDTVIQKLSEQTASEKSNSLAQLLYEQAKRNYNM